MVAYCEAGGFVYASALAVRVDIPLALICKASKLLLLTVSFIKSLLYILSLVFNKLNTLLFIITYSAWIRRGYANKS